MGLVARLFCGLRIRLLMLVLLVCAPLVALTVHQSSENKREASDQWLSKAVMLSKTSGEEEAKLLRDTRQLLLSLSALSGVREGDWENVRSVLEEELGRRPQYGNLGVLDTKGMLLVSAAPVPRTDYSAAAFFRRTMSVKDFSGGRMSIRQMGRKATMDFGHPIYGPNGMIGVMFASLDLGWIEKYESEIRSLIPARGAIWTELDAGGKVVSRYPGAETFVGRPLQENGLMAQSPAEREGLVSWSDENGVKMVSALVRRESGLAGAPVTGILSISEEQLFENAHRVLLSNMTWLMGATAVALLLGWVGSQLLVLRPIKSIARASARLAAGDMQARTGLKHGHDELGELTTAFDQMAEALEHREQERLNAAKKLQVLSHKLVEVQENERRHIARELHDEIGQSLTAAEMNLQAALQSPRSANIERRIAASMQAVEQVLEQVHDLSLNLRPSMLDDLGLEPALRWLTRRQSELAGMEAEFRADHLEQRLHPIIETECFRIAQEALTNVLRHSKARNISVSLGASEGRVDLRVRDDGKGFDVGQLRGDAVRGASLGVLSMEERASLAGGGIKINSTRGRGTEVHAWFPLIFAGQELPDEFEENTRKLRVL